MGRVVGIEDVSVFLEDVHGDGKGDMLYVIAHSRLGGKAQRKRGHAHWRRQRARIGGFLALFFAAKTEKSVVA